MSERRQPVGLLMRIVSRPGALSGDAVDARRGPCWARHPRSPIDEQVALALLGGVMAPTPASFRVLEDVTEAKVAQALDDEVRV